MRILIFGDSTAQGYYDLEMGGWPQRLFVDSLKRKVRNPGNHTAFFNVSISGDTTRRIIDRLAAEVMSRRWEDEPVMLMFAVGVNDAMVSDGKPLSTQQQYRAELEELYVIAEPLAKYIMFVGPESVNEAESAPWKFNSGMHELVWKNDRIKLFDDILKSFAADKGALYVSIFDAFRAKQKQGIELHADGLHPNGTGHQLMYELVRAELHKHIDFSYI